MSFIIDFPSVPIFFPFVSQVVIHVSKKEIKKRSDKSCLSIQCVPYFYLQFTDCKVFFIVKIGHFRVYTKKKKKANSESQIVMKTPKAKMKPKSQNTSLNLTVKTQRQPRNDRKLP